MPTTIKKARKIETNGVSSCVYIKRNERFVLEQENKTNIKRIEFRESFYILVIDIIVTI